MRRRIIDNLYVGTLEDCEGLSGVDGWAVVHACKHPCHHAKRGNPKPESEDYLSYQEGTHLYLNMIDPPAPLFQKPMFDAFLVFAADAWERGKKILIHCNKGESRAPTLALLFLSRVLYKITAVSYDDAWDEFEALLNTGNAASVKYHPGKGLEEWMRQHWDEFTGGRRLPAMETGAKEVPVPDLPKLEGDISIAMTRTHPLIHFAAFTQIEGKEHEWITPTPNCLQLDIAEAYDWCMANNVPCRLIILKPRQVGCSTFCAELCYHHVRRIPSDMIIMGDVAKRTEKVWSIFQDIPTRDSFDWKDSAVTTRHTEKTIFTYSDKSTGLVEHDTALDPKAGISGTRQVVWLTEAARYMKSQGRDKKVITAVLNSLPPNPKTLGIAESTPEGASGWFYENWQGAVTLEQRKKGIVGNGWIKVFAAWFEFSEHRLARTPENFEYFEGDLSKRERRGIDLYNWNDEQIAWRRKKILQDCANDPRMFDQDFAEDAESCFLASGRPRFDMEAVTRYEKRAQVAHGLGQVGILNRTDRGEVNFLPTDSGESWVWVIEKPKPGFSYYAAMDCCLGEQSEGSAFPDAHAFGVMRAGYFDRNVWVKPRLVCVIDVPNGCRWDDSLVAERAKRILDWYGDCEVAPEINNGLGVLHAFKENGARVYQREKMDNMYPGAPLNVIGWDTNKNTRPMVIDAISKAITNQDFDCEYLPAIEEMKTFIISDRGKAEAKSGCHDDWVMMLGILLFLLERASPMPVQRIFAESKWNTPARPGIGANALS